MCKQSTNLGLKIEFKFDKFNYKPITDIACSNNIALFFGASFPFLGIFLVALTHLYGLAVTEFSLAFLAIMYLKIVIIIFLV